MERVDQGRRALASLARAWTGLLIAYIVVYFSMPPHITGWVFIALGLIAALALGLFLMVLRWMAYLPRIQEKEERRLTLRAFRDEPTGLATRALFLDRISHSLSRRSLDPDRSIAVLLVDIEDLKTVNDGLGDPAGDEFVKAVAGRLLSCLRTADTAARLGGDEFGVLIEEMHFPEDAEMVAERIIAAMTKPFQIDGGAVLSAASVGIAISSTGLSSAEELLHNSTVAMHKAKQSEFGYTKYAPNMHEVVRDPTGMKPDLSIKITKGELEL